MDTTIFTSFGVITIYYCVCVRISPINHGEYSLVFRQMLCIGKIVLRVNGTACVQIEHTRHTHLSVAKGCNMIYTSMAETMWLQ
jgi:hypothetical protein